ncbi:N,N-dimethylformamidase beta subunit family domain-containing protein [Nonomuraea sp. NBC_01738]|uniref:N,N-dimethylformamidase beta subunit family domain-containing protein n=1 Tax=Nonomuraea sp. NBC_01738 TaxID=2976003 RepID=UPI002E0DCFB5
MITPVAAALLAVTTLLATGCGGDDLVPLPTTTPKSHTASPPPPSAWRITKQGAEHEIEGYADHVSVLPGERFTLKVSTTAPRFTVRAYRMGARPAETWASGKIPGVRQAAWRRDEGMVSAAHWKPSLTVDTKGWQEGAYLLRLDASTGGQRYVPVTVRSASTAGKVVLVNAVTTWQAYNRWGGYNLYEGPGGFAQRSRQVTFDRPYDTSGARLFLDMEKDAIEVAERSGVPLAYLTSLDLRPGILAGARAVVSMGHDEYWSPEMRAEVTKARDGGTNLAFLGANAVYWKIATKGRVVQCDKELRCPLWRESRPESALVGQMYDCFPAEADYVVRRPGHWIFRGTVGRRFAGMAGVETDKVSRGSPADVEVLAESPLSCGGRSTVAQSTYYTAPGGAGVFASGTMRWVCAMRGRHCGHGVGSRPPPSPARRRPTCWPGSPRGRRGRSSGLSLAGTATVVHGRQGECDAGGHGDGGRHGHRDPVAGLGQAGVQRRSHQGAQAPGLGERPGGHGDAGSGRTPSGRQPRVATRVIADDSHPTAVSDRENSAPTTVRNGMKLPIARPAASTTAVI